MDALGDLDHCMILVDDLDAADVALLRLGFRPTPRGVHSAHMGTANATVLLGNATYLEPLGVLKATEANAAQRARLAIGPGPFGAAFKTADAEAAARLFEAAGIGGGPAQAFARPVELPDGVREAAFRVARTRPGSVPGAWPFACEHRTPEIVWREDFLQQPNGATALREVVGVAEDLGAVARGWSVFGARVLHTADRVEIASATAPIRFITPHAFVERFGAGARPHLPLPCLAAFVVEVASLTVAADRLAIEGEPATETSDGRLVTARVPELGCAFELRAA